MSKGESLRDIKVSVIIPIYNMEKYIEECVNSILNQSLKEIEVICVDDGSTDGSDEILRKLAAQDESIVIHRQEKSGIAVARNEGIKLAKGEYLSILDVDDFFDRNMLKDSYESAKSACSEICIFRAHQFDDLTGTTSYMKSTVRDNLLPSPDTRQLTPDDVCDRLFSFVILWAWDKLFKRDFIIKNQIVFQNQRTTNDAGFVAIALAMSKKINICDTAFAIHRINRINSLSVTRDKSWSCFNEAFKFIESRLKKEGLFEKYFHAMQNWILDFAIWNLLTINGPCKRDIYSLIRDEIFPRYEIWNHSRDYYLWDENYTISLYVKNNSFENFEKKWPNISRKIRIKKLNCRLRLSLRNEGPFVTFHKICRKIFRKIFKKK